MARSLTGYSKDSDLAYDDAHRSLLVARKEPLSDYSFGRKNRKAVRVFARGAAGRLRGFFKNLIAAIADAKMRRVKRELELRGYRYDPPNNDWMSCESVQARVRKN